MRRLRVAPLVVALLTVVMTTLTGCSGGQGPSGSTPPATPDATLAEDEVVGLARPSIVKIRAEATSCNKLLQGTGFVVGANRVVSNAHVVAGGEKVTVQAEGKDFDARVVSFDPNADISVLDVPGLSAPALSLANYEAKPGSGALVLGFPGATEFTAMPARIREVNNLNGPNIYNDAEVTRPVYIYTIADGRESHGASGSPLIDMTGRVLGVVFGNEVANEATGFALTAAEVAPLIADGAATQPVATGACLS